MDKQEGKRYGKYILGKLIGTGTYGYVYQCQLYREDKTATNETFAIKLIKLQAASDRHWELVEREVEVLQRVEEKKHPNIVSFKENFTHNDTPCVVMELCEGGTLFEKIKNLKSSGKVMSEEEFIKTVEQIASGVEVLHDLNIIHRDLKTKNILLTKDGTCKIGDFGVAKIIEIARFNTKGIGTPYYMCPEIISGKPYDQKADIWSLGCTCYEIATGSYAFGGNKMNEIKEAVQSGKLPKTSNIEYSDEIKNLIVQMLSQDGANRPTVKGVLKYLQDYKEQGAKQKKRKPKKSKKHKDKEYCEETLQRDSGVESYINKTSLDPRKLQECKEFLEKESAKLQATLVTEIKSHKAADIVSYIKHLQKKETDINTFKDEIVKHIGKDIFFKLFPVMQAMKCIEDGRRELKEKGTLFDTTIPFTKSRLDDTDS